MMTDQGIQAATTNAGKATTSTAPPASAEDQLSMSSFPNR